MKRTLAATLVALTAATGAFAANSPLVNQLGDYATEAQLNAASNAAVLQAVQFVNDLDEDGFTNGQISFSVQEILSTVQ